MLLSGVFFVLISQLSVFISCQPPTIKMVVFRTGNETPEQVALLPRIEAFASLYGGSEIEEHSLPSGETYQSQQGEKLHSTWYKMEVTRGVMASNPAISWILTFELSALPTDGSAAINFADLIAQNPSVSVFLKRAGTGFGMSLYKNDEATRTVVDSLWGKRSVGTSVAAAYTNFAFWNLSILTKIKFL